MTDVSQYLLGVSNFVLLTGRTDREARFARAGFRDPPIPRCEAGDEQASTRPQRRSDRLRHRAGARPWSLESPHAAERLAALGFTTDDLPRLRRAAGTHDTTTRRTP